MLESVQDGVITTGELSGFMKGVGYYWSNEAQVYYHESYKLPIFTYDQAVELYIMRIKEDGE